MVDRHGDEETVVLSKEAIEQMHGRKLASETESVSDDGGYTPGDTCEIPVLIEEGSWLS